VQYVVKEHLKTTLLVQDVVNWWKLQFVTTLLYPPAVVLPKLSIICLYLRIFTIRRYRYAAFVIAAVLIINWAACWIIDIAVCHPRALSSDKSMTEGYCLNHVTLIWISVPNIATDIAILVLPHPIFWRLQTSRAQKIGLTMTFLTGSM
jgi:hypothetical protein